MANERMIKWSFPEPALTGLVAGVTHHSIFQRPVQARLFPTLYGYACLNCIFIILLIGANNRLTIADFTHLIWDVFVFNTIYVNKAFPKVDLKRSNRRRLCWKWYTMCISVIEGYRPNFGTPLVIGHSGKKFNWENHTWSSLNSTVN